MFQIFQNSNWAEASDWCLNLASKDGHVPLYTIVGFKLQFGNSIFNFDW